VIETFKEVLGAEYPDTLTSIANLAVTYWNQGRWKEAEEMFIKVMETRKRVLGEEHPDTLTSMANLAFIWKSQGHNNALVLMRECFLLQKQNLGAGHPDTISSFEALNDWERATLTAGS
jgi:Tetratricopeptide repeat